MEEGGGVKAIKKSIFSDFLGLKLWFEGRLCSEMASMAKYWATDLENKVAGDCLQLHGGWGFMWETQGQNLDSLIYMP